MDRQCDYIQMLLSEMSAAQPRRFIKPGTVVLCLRGRQAGKKAVVLKSHEGGTNTKKFAFATVVGVQRPPRQV